MKNFMILIREDIAETGKASEEEMQAEIQEYTHWVEELAKTDNYVSGEPLESEGRYITKDNVHSDGPFIESKEVVTGYILIKAENMEKAVELAKGCPVFKHGGVLELRPVMIY